PAFKRPACASTNAIELRRCALLTSSMSRSAMNCITLVATVPCSARCFCLSDKYCIWAIARNPSAIMDMAIIISVNVKPRSFRNNDIVLPSEYLGNNDATTIIYATDYKYRFILEEETKTD